MNGKSTIAYGLRERGYTLWADDSVVFEMVDGVACALPIPFRIHLRPATLSHFNLKSNVTPSWPGLYFGDDPQRSHETVSTIFVLERRTDGSGDVGEAFKVAPHEALITLLTHARCFSLKDEERRQQMMQNYLQLVNGVPVILLRFTSGLERLSAVLDQVEEIVSPALVSPSG